MGNSNTKLKYKTPYLISKLHRFIQLTLPYTRSIYSYTTSIKVLTTKSPQLAN